MILCTSVAKVQSACEMQYINTHGHILFILLQKRLLPHFSCKALLCFMKLFLVVSFFQVADWLTMGNCLGEIRFTKKMLS